MKNRLSIIVLVALVALMAASSASARMSTATKANQHASKRVLVKKAPDRWSHRALL